MHCKFEALTQLIQTDPFVKLDGYKNFYGAKVSVPIDLSIQEELVLEHYYIGD